jgi:hypothetical protein
MKNNLRSAGPRPAVEPESRRLLERTAISVWQRELPCRLQGGRDARRTAGETPALQGAR